MLVHDRAIAQIRLVLASNDKAQVRQLSRDLQVSKYLYNFVHHDDSATVVHTVKAQIAQAGANSPVVIVIDYKFAKKDCEVILELVRIAARHAPIECVVTNPPGDENTRARLSGLGARVFDENEELILPELTLH